jgi:hypothetical protein
MYSGIKEKINNIKKLDIEEKQELKEHILSHHKMIRDFMNSEILKERDIFIPHAVRNALEDRLIELNQAYNKL